MTTRPDDDYADIAVEVGSLLESIDQEREFPALLQRAPLNETWFSDILAWLLDTRGSHGLKSAFAEGFLKTIARIRTQGHKDKSPQYGHRKKYLRWGKRDVAGTLSTDFDLKNSAVFREFYLASRERGALRTGGMLCDVVFLDLDPADGIFVTIENKLFSTNHKGQLETYFQTVEERYKRAKVQEYVYLTLDGEAPVQKGGCNPRILEKSWVRMSWIQDILGILKSISRKSPISHDVKELVAVLEWLKTVLDPNDKTKMRNAITRLFTGLVSASSECLLEELNRLSKGARGKWKDPRKSTGKTRIVHTSKPKVPLYVGVLPNLSIVLYSNERGRNKYDKLLIPFGSNPDQIFNLMDLVARDVYPLHFGPSYKLYLGKQRRLTVQEQRSRKNCRDFFQFVHIHRQQIQLLMPLARRLQVTGVLDETEL